MSDSWTLFIRRPHGSDRFPNARAVVREDGILEVRRYASLATTVVVSEAAAPPLAPSPEVIAAFKEWNYWKYLTHNPETPE